MNCNKNNWKYFILDIDKVLSYCSLESQYYVISDQSLSCSILTHFDWQCIQHTLILVKEYLEIFEIQKQNKTNGIEIDCKNVVWNFF